jgi:hypothetical protein
MIFPLTCRYDGLKWNKYTVVKAIGYGLNDYRYVSCKGPMGYSHVMFEQWIMKSKDRVCNYLHMVTSIVVKSFHDHYLPGQKILIYMSTIELCKLTARYINNNSTLSKYSCQDYTSEHDDSVLHTNDIIITTPGKSGSGKDIKGLMVVISTVSIDAREKNIQMLGRLRNLSDVYPNVDPVYFYLVCTDVDKHIQYHKNKLVIFTPLVKSINYYRSNYRI